MKAKYIKKIVGLVGKKHSGKDTFYLNCLELHLEGKLSLYPKRFAFADELKKEVAKANDITVEQINKDKQAYRSRLQDIGVAKRREDKEFWVKALASSLISYEGLKENVPTLAIITDVRFINEAEFIKSIDGKLIRIIRTETDDAGDTHISETELTQINYDYPLNNPSKPLLYKQQILDTLKQLNLCN